MLSELTAENSLLPRALRAELAQRVLPSAIGMNADQLERCIALVPQETADGQVTLRLINQSPDFFYYQRDFIGNDPRMLQDPTGFDRPGDYFPVDEATGLMTRPQPSAYLPDRNAIREIEQAATELFRELTLRSPSRLRAHEENGAPCLTAESWGELAAACARALPGAAPPAGTTWMRS